MSEKRYCGMCDEWVRGKECPKCGADTDRAVAERKEPIDMLKAVKQALDNRFGKID